MVATSEYGTLGDIKTVPDSEVSNTLLYWCGAEPSVVDTEMSFIQRVLFSLFIGFTLYGISLDWGSLAHPLELW